MRTRARLVHPAEIRMVVEMPMHKTEVEVVGIRQERTLGKLSIENQTQSGLSQFEKPSSPSGVGLQSAPLQKLGVIKNPCSFKFRDSSIFVRISDQVEKTNLYLTHQTVLVLCLKDFADVLSLTFSFQDHKHGDVEQHFFIFVI